MDRSTSRGRTSSNKFRIQDETIGISENLKESPVFLRPHRSLSRAPITAPRGSGDQLLHQALQNQTKYNHKGIKRQDQKIKDPKETREVKIDRPQIKRWNSIQYLSQQKDLKDKAHDPASISPLTVIKDQYNTRRPMSNYIASPDNTFQDLDLPVVPEAANPQDKMSNKIYNKMVLLLQSSYDGPVETPASSSTLPPRKSVSTTRTSLLKFQSELDEELDEEYEERTELNTWDSPNINVQNDSNIDAVDVSAIMDEIHDFQSNFVQKFNQVLNQENESRVQQKILDYRDLQEDGLSRTPSYFNLKNSAMAQFFGSYNFKIQYETIIHQYNQIRLRFSDAPDFELYSIGGRPVSNKDTLDIKSDVGVLGFLARQEIVNRQRGKYTGGASSDMIDSEEYIQKIWSREMDELFPPNVNVNM